jgi:hypothetical protein
MRILPSFAKAIDWTGELMRTSAYEVRGSRWQSTDVSTKPEMRMKEILNHSFQVNVRSEDIETLQKDIMPNLPWAEDHFLERVGGKPLNPGETWRSWPWALSADKFRTEGEKFSHTYMERYWPKSAGMTDLQSDKFACDQFYNHGIRYEYGDLNDVVTHLLGDPLSRQAYLPVWFPEDTGVVHGERVPCSLGYHWILRNGYLHTSYYIRSCDFVRHFRDDLYLSIRLTVWLLNQLRDKQTEESVWPGDWKDVKLGFLTFHCVSMHCFVNDWNQMYARVAV